MLTNSAKELELGVLLVVQHTRGLMVHRGHDVNVLGMLWAAHALVGRIFQEGCGWGKMMKNQQFFSAILGDPPPVISHILRTLSEVPSVGSKINLEMKFIT